MSRLIFSLYSLYIICRKITTFQATSQALALATWSDKPWNQKTCHGYSQSWEKHKCIGAASVNWFSIVHGLKLFQTSSFPGVFPKKGLFSQPLMDKNNTQQFGSCFFVFFFVGFSKPSGKTLSHQICQSLIPWPQVESWFLVHQPSC